MTLAALEARLRQDLSWLELPPKPWVIARSFNDQPMLDVAIVGGGMAGLAAAGALKLLGIHAVIFDRSPVGFEGPWATTARMETLRSPKQLTGPALGLPALTFRAWYEAQFGIEQWQALDKIPRLQWMDYLRWYRKVLSLEVHNEQNVEQILMPASDRIELRIRHAGQLRSVHARRLILATGRDGLGAPWVPEFAASIARERWAHSADTLDYSQLRGLRVGVIGGSASAMDSAATALEAGAAKVDLLIRRSDLPRINKGKGAGSPGMSHGFYALSDNWKWRIRHYLNEVQSPPPHGSTLRVSKHKHARFFLGCPVLEARMHENLIHLTTARGIFKLDFVVFCTGFRVNFGLRPEFASFASQVRFWQDRYAVAPGQEDEELAESPDLGPVFEFQEKTPGACPTLSRIHCFCYPAILSHGALTGDVPAISEGAHRLAQGIASLLFNEDIDEHFMRMQNYDDPELLGDEWRAAGENDQP
jgi:FAD-dependent urate hydroxylase